MKILDTPRVNRLGQTVAYQSPYGLCLRSHVIPRNTFSPARQHMRAIFGSASRMWSGKLTDEQQDRWRAAAGKVMSHPTLGQNGPLTAQQFWQAINSVRGCVDLPPTFEPPAPVAFSPSVAGQLQITNDETGVRLWLAVSGQPDTDIMVFGQEPCSPGRYKRRNVSYLGLLPPPVGGRIEITHLYQARFGEPRPDRKVFIVTCQTKDGWKGMDRETSARVPEPPTEAQAPSQPQTSQNSHMHKGGTTYAERINRSLAGHPPEGPETIAGGGIAATAASGGKGKAQVRKEASGSAPPDGT
jgi:hypothetical protein